MSYSIILVDNHIVVRQGIISLLEKDDRFSVIDNISNAEMCFEIIDKTKPDIIISDTVLDDMDGLEFLTIVRKKYPNIKIVLFTESKKSTDLTRAYDIKIDGYISKNTSYETFTEALEKVMHGENYIQPEIIPFLNKCLLERDIHRELLDKLTKRETQMLICVANGLSNKEIASECKISERTVKNHLSSVFQKIEVADRTQAAVFAIKTNLIQL